MLAQSSTVVAIAVPEVSFAAIICGYVSGSKHKGHARIHPDKKDIVFKDLCDKTHELERRQADERHEEVQKHFAELKTMIRNQSK